MYEYKAIVRSIYDGDTFRADVDLGFNVWAKNLAFRLNRINAPELVKADPRGRTARDYLTTLMPVGSEVLIRTEKDKTEKYGRWLADVFSIDNSLAPVNDILVREGFAKYWDGKGERPV